MHFAMNGDRDELSAINDYFKSVLDMIPAESYFKSNQQNADAKKRLRKGKKTEAKTDIGLHARKVIAKRKKFDPSLMKTTSERVTQQNEESDTETPVKKRKRKKVNSDQEETPSITDLQKRLKEKIAEMQSQRNPKNRSQEEIDRIRARRKKERAKFKLRKKLKLQNQINQPAAELRGLPGQKNARTDGDQKSLMNGKKPIVNNQGKVVFSKFDFGEEPGLKNSKKAKLKNDETGAKKLKTLLARAESKKEKLDNLKLEHPDEANDVIKKDSWDKALARAGGTKVKDDPDLLKKSLKKEKAIKRQHAKKWKERELNVQDKMKQKKDRRERNIQARKDNVKDKKKMKRMKKFAKSVPGF